MSPLRVTDVIRPLSVQPTTLFIPGDVPIANQYFATPVSGSDDAVQFAESCVLEFDGATDIFKAKKVLGKRLCIKGDVPARILALGTKDQVLDYCRKLIEEVGEGGGFILASGCEIPPDAKPENVAAMREAVEKYGKY